MAIAAVLVLAAVYYFGVTRTAGLTRTIMVVMLAALGNLLALVAHLRKAIRVVMFAAGVVPTRLVPAPYTFSWNTGHHTA